MREQLDPLWSGIREELRREAPDFKFHIWLDPLELAGVQGTTLFVRAPEHIRTWVGERYLPLLREAAARRFDPGATVEIVGDAWTAPEAGPAAEPRAGEPPPSGLSPKYTFEQFVIGGANRFAHAAALAVAELPAQAYNPLFVHGPPGLGKTHLLHAIGNYVLRYGSGLRVRYATIDEFTSEFVRALGERQRMEAFQAGFRDSDVVLIDDVQFLATKEKTREEFFHTLNALMLSGRQVVMTSDRSPEELSGLEDRLTERFRAGLEVGLEVPGPAVRRAIIEKRAHLDGVEVPPSVLDEIAVCVSTSVRALEAALIRVVAYASMRGEAPTVELTRKVLRRLGTGPAESQCSISEILDASAREFGVSTQELVARNRKPSVAMARQVAMFLARELTDHSLPEIGRGIGGRNHTTVLHAVNRVAADSRTDAELRGSIDSLRRRLGRPA